MLTMKHKTKWSKPATYTFECNLFLWVTVLKNMVFIDKILKKKEEHWRNLCKPFFLYVVTRERKIKESDKVAEPKRNIYKPMK